MQGDEVEHVTSTSSPPLRICCYGSSSKKTPDRYLSQSHSLGYTLAKRGHMCVNGAGVNGCMGSLNEGVVEGNGDVVGVIHKMFLVDGGDWMDGTSEVFRRKGGTNGGGGYSGNAEILVADGEDLYERKRMLARGADAIVVLPGGTGTFDELWEMASSLSLGFVNIPIVCVNIDGYYDPFADMLQRAHTDGLLYAKPHDLIHFETTSVLAVQWIEAEIEKRQKIDDNNSSSVGGGEQKLILRKTPSSTVRKFFSIFFSNTLSRLFSSSGGKDQYIPNAAAGKEQITMTSTLPLLVAFSAGVFLGVNSGRRPH
mmetsp:Transcript_29783/g.35416  ORF Transcript_29783/g.35416 Transcript_29783/m.35416 type:complete len:312 (-) Transcript_29783:146-1081(-)